ncbi:MAG: circadian clock protein KaiA [Trichodesmium sp. St16_bin4-tuft]|nr:circadian clock protein KaiA [Trichodesmium sp. MAG_R01]MDE5069774.1 circadian clock protein KaiA [Trichodesmium sp. St4_bin8_1]MDE5070603.1 circadian clock protein KaiA [Trichodesmium sp. St5_bin8]MDE5078532.1 circadian clock protein KaiA [Trichodesmium sp. St2_bin6]MDE5097067.1 circadian clock protein KaiA [Trichodesmium sp. St16_bin4-tuft]MDE5103876.1 circadian clock protein KaiA [Trichodesmium sp. St19_bin2]
MKISRITDSQINPDLPTIPKALSTKLFICIYLHDDKFAISVTKLLSQDRYLVALTKSDREFVQLIEENTNIDCLLFQEDPELTSLIHKLHHRSILLPAVIIKQSESENSLENQQLTDTDNNFTEYTIQHNDQPFIYHQAEASLLINQLGKIDFYVEQAIQKFLKLSPASSSKDKSQISSQATDDYTKNILHQQQHRLYAKLRERLGYLGVYYKRNPTNFIRNMAPGERDKFVDQLKLEYRHIVLKYFSQDNSLNNNIDDFVNLCFFSDIPVTEVVEIHMDLMDEFAIQLRLEGRSEEMLLDYRLTLIDTIAHLCEMYRRSIPRES